MMHSIIAHIAGINARIPSVSTDSTKVDEIHKNTKHMEEHINFVENTYDKVKTPFHYLMDKVSLLSFSSFRRSEIVQNEKLENKETN